MNWLLLLYNILLAVVVIDAIASTIAAWYIFKLRQRFGSYLARNILANAIESWAALITAGVAPGPGRVVLWAIVIRILARVYKSWTSGRLALYLLGYLNGDRSKPPTS